MIEEAFVRAAHECISARERSLPLSADTIASFFASAPKEVKAENDYTDDREECRARFNQLVKEVNARSRTTRMSRQQALFHMLPRPPRKPRKM